jgi:porin
VHRSAVGFVFACIFSSAPLIAVAEPPDGDTKGLWERDNLLGEVGGIRPRLAQAGISFELQDSNGIWVNLRGGVNRGIVYAGATESAVRIDLDTALGWSNARAFASVEWLRGRSPTNDLIGSVQGVSQIEISPSGLRDLWLEQDLLQRRVSVRVGQERVDEEFLLSPYGGVMLNSTFGWPGFAEINIPAHRPRRGFDEPMVRLAYTPSGEFRFLAAAFKGTSGAGRDPLLIAEAQYLASKLTTYRLGAWYQTGSFPDQVFHARIHHGSFAVYAGMDRMIWRKPNTEDQGIALFARAIGGNRSFADFQINGGVNWKGAVSGRDEDTIGLGASYLRFSAEAQRQSALLAEEGEARPLPTDEIVLEATYQAQVTGWLQVQPDIQYIIHPAGRLTAAGELPRNALVIGVMTSVSF